MIWWRHNKETKLSKCQCIFGQNTASKNQCWTVLNTENELKWWRFLYSSLPASIKQHSLVNCLNVIRSVTDSHYILQGFCPDGCYCAKSSHRPFNKDTCFSMCLKFPNPIQLLCEAQKRCVCITSSRVRVAEDIDNSMERETHTHTYTHTYRYTYICACLWPMYYVGIFNKTCYHVNITCLWPNRDIRRS